MGHFSGSLVGHFCVDLKWVTFYFVLFFKQHALSLAIVNIRYRLLGCCAPQPPPNYDLSGNHLLVQTPKTLRDGYTINRGLFGDYSGKVPD